MLFNWMYPQIINFCISNFVNNAHNYSRQLADLLVKILPLTSSLPSYPNYTRILLKALDVWYYDPSVTSPVLKLMAELVLNRSQVHTCRWEGGGVRLVQNFVSFTDMLPAPKIRIRIVKF